MTTTITDQREPGFYMVDNELIDVYGPTLGAYGVAVYNVLVKYANRYGVNAFPSYLTIAKSLSMSRRKAISTVNQLVELGLVRKTARHNEAGDPTSNDYVITDVKRLLGNAQHAPPSKHNAPGGNAPGSPRSEPRSPDQDVLNKTQLRIKKRVRTRVIGSESQAAEPLAPSLFDAPAAQLESAKPTPKPRPKQPLQASPPPDVAQAPPPLTVAATVWPRRPVVNRLQLQIAERLATVGAFGIDAAQFRALTDAVLDGCGKRALAEAEDERALSGAQDAAAVLVKMGAQFRTPDGVAAAFASWAVNDYRGATPPTFDQIKEHASLMLAGKINQRIDHAKPGYSTAGSDNGTYTPQPRPEAYSGIGKPVYFVTNGQITNLAPAVDDPNLPY